MSDEIYRWKVRISNTFNSMVSGLHEPLDITRCYATTSLRVSVVTTEAVASSCPSKIGPPVATSSSSIGSAVAAIELIGITR